VRVVVLLVGLLTCAACRGAADEERTSRPARFTAAGCPVEDAALCAKAARVANAEWVSSVVYADSVEAWRTEYADPFAQLACGNVRAWGSS
jgi:hypothetical protein